MEKRVQAAVRNARRTGSMALVGLELNEVPNQVFNVDKVDEDEKWWETNPVTSIDLSHNAIEELGREFAVFVDLSVLRAAHNRIFRCSEEIFMLPELRVVDLSHNNLEILPTIGSCVNLTELHLSDNKLSELPADLEHLSSLQVLDVSSNRPLRSISSLSTKMTALRRLVVSNCSLRSLPSDVGLLPALQELEAEGNALEHCPPLGSSLVRVNLRNNRLSDLPHLPAACLDSLLLGGNNIRQVGDLLEGAGVQSLSVLDVSGCPVSRLGGEILKLKNLRTLDLRNCSLSRLPAELGFLPRLQRMPLEGNPLRSIRRPLIEGSTDHLKAFLRTRATEEELPYLERVMKSIEAEDRGDEGAARAILEKVSDEDLHAVDWRTVLRHAGSDGTLTLPNVGLESIPETVCASPHIEPIRILDLRDNNLTSDAIAPLLGALRHVTSIDLSGNRHLRTLPRTLFTLPFLKTLRISRCELRGVPDASIPSLIELDVGENPLPGIPVSLLASNLTRLSLRRIPLELEDLDVVLGRLVHLVHLDISACRLVDVPPSILGLAVLASLDLRDNMIPTLPPWLGLVESLRSLRWEGNPIRNPRRAILESSLGDLLRHLRDRMPIDDRPRAQAFRHAAVHALEARTATAEPRTVPSSAPYGRAPEPVRPQRPTGLDRREEQRLLSRAREIDEMLAAGVGLTGASERRLKHELAMIRSQLKAPI